MPSSTTATPQASPSPTAGITTATPDHKAGQGREAGPSAAARELKQADPSGPCPTALQPGTVASCTLEQSATAVFSLALPQQKDLLLAQIVATQGSIVPTVVAPDGTTVTCDDPVGPSWGSSQALRCATTQAGTYTLKVRTVTSSATGLALSYLPLQSTTDCRTVNAADLALGAPTVFSGSLALGAAGDCYQVKDLAAGDVLRTDATQPGVTPVVYDATGVQVCDKWTYPDCRLTGSAPFRITIQRYNGTAQAYNVSAARLSHPEGCTLVEPQAFGDSPDLASTAHCRTLRVTDSARYSFGPVKNDGSVPGKLFAADGTPQGGLCPQGACDLTPGDYTWAVDAYTAPAGAFGMAFHSAKETRGCVATGDTGLATGPATGTFGGPGQQLCLSLPTASGKGVYLLNRTPADGAPVAAQLLDATGAKQCETSGSRATVCKLTGTAPFRAVLTGTPSKAYGLVLHRTEETAGCTAWPQSGFDGTWGVEVPLTAAAPQACLSLPADQHSTVELVDYTNTKNQLNADVTVVDAAGTPVCTGVSYGNSAKTCQLAAGTPYTALLDGWGGADGYKLVRHDISPGANCLTPASTNVGGPGVSFDLTSALDARCVRVTAETSDKFMLAVRTSDGPNGTNALLSVVDAQGKPLCTQIGAACQLTGAKSYTVVVLASGYKGNPIHTIVDTWKVRTAAGWAPECTANPIAVEGFPQRSGVLADDSAAYCAVIDMKANQSFNVVGTSSAAGPNDIPRLRLVRDSRWTGDYGYQCTSNYGSFGGRCLSDSQAEQAVLLLTSATAGTPVEYSMQGVCDSACPVPRPQTALTSVSPSTGAAGTRVQAVIKGTGLNLGSKAKLVGNGAASRPLMSTLSVNAGGTALDVLLDTNGLAPGSYGIALDGVYGVSLPDAFTVTAATTPAKSRFLPIDPARFLDTRDGTGAPAQRVGPGGVVSLQVAGVKGVPASGVTAVVMNVTAVDPAEPGHVTVYPDGEPLPDVSNLNFDTGRTVANLVTVPVVNGKVDLRNASGTVDLLADVTGYYTDGATGSLLTSIDPARFLDTRDGTGAPAQRVGPGGVVSLQVAGVKGVPASGVTAVVMNVTAVDPAEPGHVTVYPDGEPLPDVSNLNFDTGRTVANLVTVPVVNGKVDLRNASGTVDLLADVTGYYGDSGSTFSPTTPVRLLDTRSGIGARAGTVGTGGTVSVPVTALEGVPAAGVTAVVLNVTVTEPTADSQLTVHPHGTARPDTANLTFVAGQTTAGLVVVPVVDGRVTFFNGSGDTHVIADLNGYFTA
ncbi:hypothetical protein [Streptomyces sp. CBMA123]|uniref:hypothetical protein n=1 Tax=Streptomyces sp. CBMA123 TaxID=1896313 RepID=UPI0016619113|nr:hypothetical protein [Streptomyces sp. CBMA123]MBD0695073.1 hypothetical protein [Streptomyces sp. CBMA123]